jgi:hypothetical protein
MPLVDEDLVRQGVPEWRRDSTGRPSRRHCPTLVSAVMAGDAG